MNNGIIIALNESGERNRIQETQLHHLSQDTGYDYATPHLRETAENLTDLVHSALREGYTRLIYVTDPDFVGAIETGLREDFGHLFEDISCVPAVYDAVPLRRFREAPQAQAQPQPQAAPQPAQQPQQAPQPAQAPAPAAAGLVEVFMVPTNIPLQGTKQLLFEVANKVPVLWVPTAHQKSGQWLNQEYLKDAVAKITGKAILAEAQNVNIESAQAFASEIASNLALLKKTGSSVLIHTSQYYGSILQSYGLLPYIKGQQAVAGKHYYAIYSAANSFPDSSKNNVAAQICSEIAKVAFDEKVPFDESVLKGKPEYKPDELDKALVYFIGYRKVFEEGQMDFSSVKTADSKAAAEKVKKALGAFINKNDVEAANMAIDYAGFSLVTDVAKAVKNAGGELSKGRKEGGEKGKKPLNGDNEKNLKIWFHKRYPELKKMFDTPS